MSKSRPTEEADNNGTPIDVPGDCCPNCVGDRRERSRRNPRQRRFGERAYMEEVGFGQPPFCNFISRRRESLENPRGTPGIREEAFA